MNRGESPLFVKSRLLAIYGVYMSRCLVRARMYRMADQLQGAAISVANNISEAQTPQSRKDFINKLKIAQKEAYEAETLCTLATGIPGIIQQGKQNVLDLIDEICRLLTASIVTAKRNA